MSNENNQGKWDGLPVEARLLITLLLAGLIMVGAPYFYKAIGVKLPEPPPEQTAKSAANAPPSKPEAAAVAATKAETKPAADHPTAKPADMAATDVAASAPEAVTVDTPLFTVKFSNRGAIVESWTLKQYKDRSGKPLELVNSAAVPKTGFPFQYDFRGAKPPVDLNQSLFRATKSGNGLAVTFEFAGSGATATKSFVFQPDSYLLQVTSSVTNNGQGLGHLLAWRGGFGDMAVGNAASQQSAVRFNTGAQKIERDPAKEAKNGPVNRDGSFSWVGVEDQYFAAVFLPVDNASIQTTVFDDAVKTTYNTNEEPFVGMAVGGDASNRMSLYVGPKDSDTLRKLGPKLEQLIDFGWLAMIAKPLFMAVRYLNDNYCHNYGWAIIIATIIINIVLFPLKFANIRQMRKMQTLQPEINKINEKYKGLSLKDPRQAEKNQEMMDLYGKAGTNPMAGCIPMLIQMPFLFAFYKVLSVSIAMRGASFLWVTDLSQPEQIAIRVLPIILVATGFLMQKMTPMTTMDPSQQKTMMMMPLMMGFIFYQASSGLVLYWLTGNLMGILQQYILNKIVPPPKTAPVVIEAKKSKNNRK